MITKFYGEHRFLSNFWISPFTYYGRHFHSVEHAYQWVKCADPDEAEQMLMLASPSECKRFGRGVKMREKWEQEKVGFMCTLVDMKFTTHRQLDDRLASTGFNYLIEGNTWGDKIWGAVLENGVWVGENWLGRILMARRLKSQAMTNLDLSLAIAKATAHAYDPGYANLRQLGQR